jgi:hypothetical protein
VPEGQYGEKSENWGGQDHGCSGGWGSEFRDSCCGGLETVEEWASRQLRSGLETVQRGLQSVKRGQSLEGVVGDQHRHPPLGPHLLQHPLQQGRGLNVEVLRLVHRQHFLGDAV